MALSDEIKRLTENLLAAYDDRMIQESERLAQALEDARRRAEYVAALRSNTGALLGEFDAAHQEMAAELGAHLGEQESERLAQAKEDARVRAEYVAALRSNTGAMLSDFQTEYGEARRAWSNLATLMQERRAGRSPAPAPKVVQRKMASDDLTTIRGIGLGMQSHLNEAGVHTYAQLARKRPQELRQALGQAARLANVEEWIEQAQKLA